MSEHERTIVDLKTSFLQTQIRILSQPLQPSQRWNHTARLSGAITSKSVTDAIREVNRQVRRHAKAAYPSLAVRHVAEQIDKLYWDTTGTGWDGNHASEADDGPVKLGDDLGETKVIDRLPQTGEFDSGVVLNAKMKKDLDAFEESRNRLSALDQRRQAALRRLNGLRQLEATLEPFKDPQANVQPNLATRDGRLVAELDRGRELSVRVGARITTLRERESLHGMSITTEQLTDGPDQRLQRAWDAI